MNDGKIYGAICGIISDIGAVGKNKTNEQQHFKYRGVDDVMNALQPMLAKHRVFVVPTVLEQIREDKQTKAGNASYLSIFKIKYTFFADDGSFVEAVTVGESADTGDKGSNKAMAIAFKYALFQVFCIPTEEMPDPDAETAPETTVKVKLPEKEVISKAQILELTKECMTKDKKPDTFLIEKLKAIYNRYGYHDAKDIQVKDYEKIKREFVDSALPFDLEDKA